MSQHHVYVDVQNRMYDVFKNAESIGQNKDISCICNMHLNKLVPT